MYYLDNKNWELLAESAFAAVVLEETDDAILLGAPPDVTFVDENVEGADITCVCRRGNLNPCCYNSNKSMKMLHQNLKNTTLFYTWCRSSCGWDWPLPTPLLTNSLKAPALSLPTMPNNPLPLPFGAGKPDPGVGPPRLPKSKCLKLNIEHIKLA